MFFIITDPMVVRFSLPEGIACFAEKLVGFASCESFPALSDCGHGFIRHRPEDHVNVVGHDDPGMEVITSAVEKPQGLNNKICYLGPFQPALTVAFIEELLEFSKVISFDLFKRILSARFLEFFSTWRQRVKAMEPFRALRLNSKQDLSGQRIRKAKSDEIPLAFAFYVRQKTARVNAGTKRIGRLWFDSGSAEFEFYTVKPWILFGGKHGGTLTRKAAKTQCSRFAECQAIRCPQIGHGLPSVTRRYSRLKICATHYTNRTNFLQRFYTSRGEARQYVSGV
jgi:hypothetical protein